MHFAFFLLLPQVVLLLGFTPWRSHLDSQLLSIACSLFLLLKVSAALITFKKKADQEEETDEDAPRGLKQKILDFVVEKVQVVQSFFQLFPLLLTSAVFNIGTMALAISILGWQALWFLFGSLFLHLVLFFTVPLNPALELKLLKRFNLDLSEDNILQDSKPLLSSLFSSTTNLFIFSRSPGSSKLHRITYLLYLQILRFLLNSSLLLAILFLNSSKANFSSVCLMVGVLGILGVAFLSLLCNSSHTWLNIPPTQK